MVKNQSYYTFVKYVSDIIFLWCPLQYSIFATLRILFYDTKGKRGVVFWKSPKANEAVKKGFRMRIIFDLLLFSILAIIVIIVGL